MGGREKEGKGVGEQKGEGEYEMKRSDKRRVGREKKLREKGRRRGKKKIRHTVPPPLIYSGLATFFIDHIIKPPRWGMVELVAISIR